MLLGYSYITYSSITKKKKKKTEALGRRPARIRAGLVCLGCSPAGLARLDPFFNGLLFLMSNPLQIHGPARVVRGPPVHLTPLLA